MNFFQLIAAYIKQNLKKLKETEDPNERKTMDSNSYWVCMCFGVWSHSFTPRCKH